eukprot:1434345-Prorocentrum_lima.AAC.1
MKEVDRQLAEIRSDILISADVRVGQDGEPEEYIYMEVGLASGRHLFRPMSPLGGEMKQVW